MRASQRGERERVAGSVVVSQSSQRSASSRSASPRISRVRSRASSFSAFMPEAPRWSAGPSLSIALACQALASRLKRSSFPHRAQRDQVDLELEHCCSTPLGARCGGGRGEGRGEEEG